MDSPALQPLLDQFFSQTEKDDLYATALQIEGLRDKRAVPPLIRALLEDENPHRRHAAARALGWIGQPGRDAALALARCVADPSQPLAARAEAAESLAYVGTPETVDALISVLGDLDVQLRFWAVFGLGGCVEDPQAFRALESMLDDPEVTPGNWWSVGKEALAMLAKTDLYRYRCIAEAAGILADPDATPEDRRWAEVYGDKMQLKWQRRLRKKMTDDLRSVVSELTHPSTFEALRCIVGDLSRARSIRREAAQLLGIDGGDHSVAAVLWSFFEQTEYTKIIEAALAIKSLGDQRTVPPLIPVLLRDPNPDRRAGAALALSGGYRPFPEAAVALARCLSDPAQPVPAREEAAEALQMAESPEAIEALLSASQDPEVVVRFWSAFGLGGWLDRDPRAVRALESLLDDAAQMPDSYYWSVGKEALGMLGHTDAYRERCAAEIARILADENASKQDRNWAEFYSK